MDIHIMFNWPIGQDRATVSFGAASVEDVVVEFRVGVIPGDDKEHIHWLNPGWVNHEGMKQYNFPVEKLDQVVVERRTKGSPTPSTRNVWNIVREWPPRAMGASSVSVPWTF